MDVCDMLVFGKGGTVLVPVLAAGVAVLAWLGKSYVSGFLHYFARFSDQIEILSALKAEIAIVIDHLPTQEIDRQVTDLAAIYAADPAHKLFMPLYRDTMVFDALKRDVTAITEKSLREVIAFYNISGSLDVLQASMTTERFETFTHQRRIELFRLYLETAKAAADTGKLAVAIIDSELVLIRARRSFASLASIILLGVIALLIWQGMQAVSACVAPKTANAIAQTGPHVADLLESSDERRQNRSHVTPHKRPSGANDNFKPHIAVIVPTFNPTSAFERPSISGGRNVAA